MVNDMVDLFVLLVPPNSGDELQGLKKGIVELCDMVLVNKADGKMLEMANITQAEYLSALKYVRRKSKHWAPQVQKVSSVEQTGLDSAWETMMQFYRTMLTPEQTLADDMSDSGIAAGVVPFEQRRRRQRKTWMWRHLTEELIETIRSDQSVQQMVDRLEKVVVDGDMVPNLAAQQILYRFLNRSHTANNNNNDTNDV